MFDALPQFIVGAIVLSLGLALCKAITFFWCWLGSKFIFKRHKSSSKLPSLIWEKTAPLLIYCAVLPVPLMVTLAIWDYKPISSPVSHFLSKFLGSPIIFVGSLSVIAVIHIIAMKLGNEDLSNGA